MLLNSVLSTDYCSLKFCLHTAGVQGHALAVLSGETQLPPATDGLAVLRQRVAHLQQGSLHKAAPAVKGSCQQHRSAAVEQ